MLKGSQVFKFAILGLVAVVGAAIAISVQIIPPWGHEFEKEELLTFVMRCDAGKAIFKEYRGIRGKNLLEKQSFTGMTISINGNTKYYVYSPNPDSMSPITWSFTKNYGVYSAISMEERDSRVSKEAPNMGALLTGHDGHDCKPDPKYIEK